jgi:hypothetical protein
VTAFGGYRTGLTAWRMLSNSRRAGRTGGGSVYRLDGLDQPLPVTERYPELLEIAFGQFRKDVTFERVLHEHGCVLS